MCGIVGGITRKGSVLPLLLSGLKRLEYRGYDSAGVAIIADGDIACRKVSGKVEKLESALQQNPANGTCGIAHTRWATHGAPTEANAHPQLSGKGLALVHNGIIENYQKLRTELQKTGVKFVSETDTEVVAHLLQQYFDKGFEPLAGLQACAKRLRGSYALAVVDRSHPDHIVALRSGSTLLVGTGTNGNFLASDPMALHSETEQFIFLEEGDSVLITADEVSCYDADGNPIKRKAVKVEAEQEDSGRGEFEHFMLKEIYEQPAVIKRQITQSINAATGLPKMLETPVAEALASQVKNLHIVACGTSYHAAIVARYWFEAMAGLPCAVEIASEFRYRSVPVPPNTLFITISQSGETADTLAALRYAKTLDYFSYLSICNVKRSSLARESRLVVGTAAGPEIGVASTKAFTSQLTALLFLAMRLSRGRRGDSCEEILRELPQLPELISRALLQDRLIQSITPDFADSSNALFVGRGIYFPIAKEGALKLKEISYIHAEAVAAGELKHGTLALVDNKMAIIALIPDGIQREKMLSNLEEIHARGGKIYAITDTPELLTDNLAATVIPIPQTPEIFKPIVYSIPLQLLAYHIANARGLDVDQPRNLAKSVTVE